MLWCGCTQESHSDTSVLRPGNAFICRAFTTIALRPDASKMLYSGYVLLSEGKIDLPKITEMRRDHLLAANLKATDEQLVDDLN
mgnify:CR=1 FL=1